MWGGKRIFSKKKKKKTSEMIDQTLLGLKEGDGTRHFKVKKMVTALTFEGF